MLKRLTAGGSGTIATMRDVAVAVGVSQATVSYVLNGKSAARISPDTRRRVLEAAARLEYRPNAIARAMAVGSSRTIGVYQPHVAESPLSGMWTAEVMKGIGEALHQRHQHLLLYGYRDSDDPAPGDFLDGRVDGLIVIAPHETDSLVGRLSRYRMPTVVIGGRGTESESVIAVDVDNAAGAALAVQYLAGLGHRQIAHLRGPVSVPNANDRASGFVKAMQELGIPDAPVIQAGFDSDSGFHAAMTALQSQPGITALFVCNDVAALGAMRACNELGLRIPEDISVMGFDDAPVSQVTNPRLTTMRQPACEMGRIAAECLLNNVVATSPDRAIPVSAELIPRESTAAARK